MVVWVGCDGWVCRYLVLICAWLLVCLGVDGGWFNTCLIRSLDRVSRLSSDALCLIRS